MVRVYRAHGPTDAYLVRDWLAEHGITAHVQGETLMGGRGELPVWESWPTLWVAKALEAKAKDLVRSFSATPQLVHPEWQCSCGETNPGNFGSCWSCGHDR